MSVVAAHARLSTSNWLLAARRDLYRCAAGMLPDGHPFDPRPEELDSPFVRHEIRVALRANRGLTAAALDRAADLATSTGQIAVGRHRVPVLSHPESGRLLADVLAHLQVDPDRVAFASTAQPAPFRAAVGTLTAGLALAHSLCPALLDDLLPHVSLVATLRPTDGEIPVHSASLREFPGLVLLGNPQTPIEAAEMLVHESAHARLYDMIVVHDLLPADADTVAPFAPSWRAPGTAWELERALAAAHAYSALAEFARHAGVPAGPCPPGSSSLLPAAAVRREEIGDYLLTRLDRLGRDAPAFLGTLLDRDAEVTPGPRGEPSGELPVTVAVAPGVQLQYGEDSDTVVVGRTHRPTELYLIGADAGLLLQTLLDHGGVEPAVAALAASRRLSADDAARRARQILRDLAAQDLISIPPTRVAGLSR